MYLFIKMLYLKKCKNAPNILSFIRKNNYKENLQAIKKEEKYVSIYLYILAIKSTV